MINVSIYMNKKKQHMGFKALGHAGYAVSGEDIVCSATSILMINTINAIDEFTEDAFDCLSDEREASLEMKLKKAPSKESDLLLKTMVLGLRAINEDYNKYINLTFEEV